MANYVGSGRTNYFRVKDIEVFKEWAEQFNGVKVHTDTRYKDHVCILMEDEYGDLPSEKYDEDENPIEIDFMSQLRAFLADGSVAIFQHVGGENLRYLCGYSIAVNNKGQTRIIRLDDIYKKAAKLGTVTEARY